MVSIICSSASRRIDRAQLRYWENWQHSRRWEHFNELNKKLASEGLGKICKRLQKEKIDKRTNIMKVPVKTRNI